ncbi:S4 domain-containing protein [Flammeovirga sp. SubArs3]|uniref:RNA-binding S4 domain-containing protein n=1 Tax=Flammeovirga sp. SubArs3 TaxID=2995316 RepID=UPI00248C55A5|nr:S4 domain-containing protein [Flammeovirga sp. SubArs3]
MRVDKYLWCVRIFKTRTIATDACKKEEVILNGSIPKPSQKISAGDIVEVKKAPIWRKFKVLQVIDKRVGASLVAENVEEITSKEELDKLKEYIDEKRFYLNK